MNPERNRRKTLWILVGTVLALVLIAAIAGGLYWNHMLSLLGNAAEHTVPTLSQEALDAIVPKYINSLIFGGLVESYASENGARMQAMDSATSNAEEMIEKLSLQYNRARQGSITQELTEIIAGAEAIS